MNIQQRAGYKKLLQYQIEQSKACIQRIESGLRCIGFNPDENTHLKAMHVGLASMQNELSTLIAKEVMANAEMYSDNRGFHP